MPEPARPGAPARGGRRTTVTLQIDGKEVVAEEGDTVIQAATRAGIDIPSLCWAEGLTVWGACRLCVVEIAGEHPLRPSCAVEVADEMEVLTDTERLRELRRILVELLFAEGNHVCAVCVSNGRCELQDLAVTTGVDHVRFDYQHPRRTVDASHPRYLFDPNRCVLCTRCVRTCAEIEGAHVWGVASRGSESFLVTELNRPWGESVSCTACGKCVAVCPTGALSYKGRSVGEMGHDVDLLRFLATSRDTGEWVPPEVTP
jgi:bidirectional [NiFe] hydrogenase diaphorase subunit